MYDKPLTTDGDVNRWFGDFCGPTFAKDARKWIAKRPVHRDATPPTITEWLTSPLATRIRCIAPSDQPKHHTHEITLDLTTGDLAFETHGYTVDNLDAETFLLALNGARIPPCLVVMLIVTGNHDKVAAFPQVDKSLIRAWRGYMTARAWALPHDVNVTDDERAVLIKTFTTPAQWEPWSVTGWAPSRVDQFLIAGATVEQSRPWVENGMVGKQAAKFAVENVAPLTDFAPWDAAGIDRPVAGKWHSYVQCTPEQARRFIATGVSAERVQRLLKTAPTEIVLSWVESGLDPKNIRLWIQSGVSITDALAMTGANISPHVFRRAAYTLASIAGNVHASSTHASTEQAIDQASRDLNADDFINWRQVGASDDLVIQAVTQTSTSVSVTAQEVQEWGGFPDWVRFHQRTHLTDWVHVFRTMTKARFTIWERTPVTAAWLDYPNQMALSDITLLEHCGFTPEFLSGLSATHKMFLRVSANPAALIESCDTSDEAHGVLDSGVLSDEALHNDPAILGLVTRTDIADLVSGWRARTTPTYDEVYQ